MNKKKNLIKEVVAKKTEDNQKELLKWKELLFVLVDECIDEKIEKLDSQVMHEEGFNFSSLLTFNCIYFQSFRFFLFVNVNFGILLAIQFQANYFRTTYTEIEKTLDIISKKQGNDDNESDSDNETEDPKLDDLLALKLDLQPDGLSVFETTEMESRIKSDFNVLLNEPKKSLRRTFAYVGGIIRGYLRRGKSNIDWIKIMRGIYTKLCLVPPFILNRIGRKRTGRTIETGLRPLLRIKTTNES